MNRYSIAAVALAHDRHGSCRLGLGDIVIPVGGVALDGYKKRTGPDQAGIVFDILDCDIPVTRDDRLRDPVYQFTKCNGSLLSNGPAIKLTGRITGHNLAGWNRLAHDATSTLYDKVDPGMRHERGNVSHR